MSRSRRTWFLAGVASVVLVAVIIGLAWAWQHRIGSKATTVAVPRVPSSSESNVPSSNVKRSDVAGAVPAPAVDLELKRRQAAAALAGMIQRGALIVGTLTDDTGRESHAVLFEVTASSNTTHQISLDLRNDRGLWTHTRAFTGEWRMSTDADSCTLNLRSSGGNGDRSGGPVLNNESTLYLTLQVWPDGAITATPRTWQLHAVAAADIAVTKARFGFAAPGPDVDVSRAPAATAVPSTTLATSKLAEAAPPRAAPVPSSDLTSAHPANLHPANLEHPSAPATGDATPTPRSSATGNVGVPPAPGTIRSTLAGSESLNLQHSNLQPATSSSPMLPATRGAYVFIAGQWQLLPHNHGHLVQSAEQAEALLDRMAGKAAPADDKPVPVGSLLFDVDELPPKAAGANLTLAYVGPRNQPTDTQLEQFPTLRTQPALELAPLKIGRSNVRSCALYFAGAGILGFGPHRIAATVETPSETITIVHITVPLAPGHYALSCGSLDDTYEFIVP